MTAARWTGRCVRVCPAIGCLALLALASDIATGSTFAPVPGLRVVRAELTDDGDNDGWADTRETVAMRVTVRNLTGADLTGLVLLASTDSPAVAAITDNRIDFGDLADGESRLSEQAFEFVMSSSNRTSLEQSLSATFRFRSWSDQHDLDELPGNPPDLTIDLDLDASGGGAPTTFYEGFESGFGQFTTMHLDESLNPPPGDINNHALGRAAADRWRCQYSDPDWVNSMSYNTNQGPLCYPSQNGVQDTYYWHTAAERAFEGEQSLHWGVFLDPAALYTTPRAQLEAIRTTDPIPLGWSSLCSVSRTTFCVEDTDCPSGEACEPSAPVFSFKHQISLMDCRSFTGGCPGARSPERGIVAAQLASSVDGSPVGPWIRLEPWLNVYDSEAQTVYRECTFDPADDGNTEEDFFDPTDPLRSLGPSSTCFPNHSFVFLGSTVKNDPARLGQGSDGPGLLGARGPGTWVESAFDLSRFRGRSVRLRYLATGLKSGSSPLWHPGFVNNTAANPSPRDDGWFIDSVNVTDVLDTPASLREDTKANTGLPGLDDPDDDQTPLDNCPFVHNPDQADTDGDGAGDVCDECPSDPYDDRYGHGACCPATAEDDADGDGVCGTADSCPRVFNPPGRAAYRVAKQVRTRFGYFDPPPPALLTGDGRRVVYVSSANLYSVPVTGGAPTLLWARPGPQYRGVDAIGQTPDGATIVFLADSQVAGRSELHQVPVTGGAVKLLSVALSGAEDRIESFVVAPDGKRIVYHKRLMPDYGLHSVLVGGGSDVWLYFYASQYAVSPNGQYVVYLANSSSSSGVKVIPIGGGSYGWGLGPTSSGASSDHVHRFVISGDGSSVVSRLSAAGDDDGLYVAPIIGGDATKISGSARRVSDSFATASDGSEVIYVADYQPAGDIAYEVYRVGIDGTGRVSLASAAGLYDLTIAPDDSRVVWGRGTYDSDLDPSVTEGSLHSIDLEGGTLDPLSPVSRTVGRFRITPDSSVVVYADAAKGLVAVPIDGGASTLLVPAGPGETLWLPSFTRDSRLALFRSTNATGDSLWLVPLAVDTDTDGLVYPCDCDPSDSTVYVGSPEINDGQDNQCPGETGAGLVDELGDATCVASGSFEWPPQAGATLYEVARASSADFEVDCTSWATTEPSWSEPELPPSGTSFYYLFRALQPHAGSWGADAAGSARAPACIRQQP